MQSYITKPKSVRRKEIAGREWSFSVNSYHSLSYRNKNTIKLNELKEEGFLGKNPKQVNFKTKYQMIKISSFDELSFTVNYNEIANTEPFNYSLEKGNWIFFATRGVIIHKTTFLKINENVKIIHSNNMFAMKIKDEYLFYLIAFLKSQLFIDYAKNSSPDGAVPAFLPNQILNFDLPLPTTKNNPNPKAIEELVSVLVQNIIDKEEQIKAKNAEIDRQIETELYGNQKKSSFVYSMPRISEIRREGRLDTGLYTEEFKKIDNLIKCYGGGCERLKKFVKKFYSGTTPIFFQKKSGDYPYFVRPTEFGDNRLYKDLRKIHTNPENKYRIDTEEGIILPRKGGVNAILKPNDFNVIIGDSVKFAIFKDIDISFLASFLTSKLIRFILENVKSKTNGGSLTESDLTNLSIPIFPTALQQRIARLYYNKIDKNSNLTLENYLEKEKARNREAGIFQLNMEIFALREKLENIVHKIVMEEEIEFEFD